MLLDDIADYLSTQGVGTVGTDVFKGYMPDKPPACIAIYETGGTEPYRGFAGAAGRALAEATSIQIVARATEYDYSTARTTMNTIWKLLDGFGDTTVNGVRYLWIGAKQSPFLMRRDENNLVYAACNFDVVKELT